MERKKGNIDYCEVLRKGQTKEVEKQEIIRTYAFHAVIYSRHHMLRAEILSVACCDSSQSVYFPKLSKI